MGFDGRTPIGKAIGDIICRIDYGNPRRFDITAGSGKHYRLRYIDGHACCEPVIPPSVHLFCGDCDLWTPLLLQGENAKVIIDTSEFNSREPFIEKKGSLFYLYSCSSSFFATFVLQNKTSKIFRIT